MKEPILNPKLTAFLSRSYYALGYYFVGAAVFSSAILLIPRMKLPSGFIAFINSWLFLFKDLLYLPLYLLCLLFGSDDIFYIGAFYMSYIYILLALYILLPRYGYQTYVATHAVYALCITLCAAVVIHACSGNAFKLRIGIIAALFCTNEIRLIVKKCMSVRNNI